MKRKLLLISSTILISIVALVYSSAAWWIGKSAEETLQKQIDWLKNSTLFTVKTYQYQRGWFSSEATTVLSLRPQLIPSALQLTERYQLNQNDFEIVYKQHITHGPLPLLTSFNFLPYKAAVSTDIIFSARVKELLANFFGKQKPITIHKRIAFNEDSQVHMNIPGFNYEETISGVKMDWSGLDTKMKYNSDHSSRFSTQSTIAKADISALPYGILQLNNIHFNTHNEKGQIGLTLGDFSLFFDHLDLKTPNERPSHITLNKLLYSGKLSEEGIYINSDSQCDLETFSIEEKQYGPAKFIAEMNHLHGPSMLTLSNAMQIPLKMEGLKNEEEYNNTINQSTFTLLENHPTFTIREFFVKTPQGDINMRANFSIPRFARTDLQNGHLWRKIDANAYISIPRPIIESIILAQVGNLDEGNKELDDFLEKLVESQVNKLIQDKFVRVEGNNIVTDIILKEGDLSLNGQLLIKASGKK